MTKYVLVINNIYAIVKELLMHYYHTFPSGNRISLVGSVITIFDPWGRKVRQYFYSNHKAAKSVFMSLV